MTTVYIKKIEPIDKNAEEKIIASLSKSATERLDKKKNESLRLASMTALSLLTSEQQKELYYTESGIPYFKAIYKNVSISHSKKYCAVAISDFSVGIDVEDTDNEGNALRFARFFTESEKKEIENGISPIEIWTKKEALFKYLKNDDISFISIDTTKAHNHCETIHLDDAILSIYTEANEKITIQKL